MLTPLPGGPIDHHWTKGPVASEDGTKLYAGVGSNSNITENGIGAELDRAAIWEVDSAAGAHQMVVLQTLRRSGRVPGAGDAGGDLEDIGNEGSLRLHVPCVDVASLSLPDHRHRLVASQGPPGRSHTPTAGIPVATRPEP